MSRSRSIKTFAAASRQNVKGAAKINKNVTHERSQAGSAPGGLSSQPRVVPVHLGRQSTKPPRMRSGCHEHCCPTTSGGSWCSVCHGCVTALNSHGGMDSGFCFTLGDKNNFEGLQAPIRLSSSSILRRSVLPRPGVVSSHPSGRNLLPAGEGSDMHCASRSVSERFLLQVLPGPETGRDRDSPDPGSEGPEPMPQKVQIQNAHALIPFASDSPERLVHLNRPEGRILSYSRVPSTQDISEVCLSGSVLRIHRAPIRPLAEPEGVCQVYGGGDRPSEREGHSTGHIFRRLAPAGTIQRGGSVKHAGCDPSLVWSGFQNKLAEKRFTPLPENNLSRSESGLRGVHGPSLDTARGRALALPGALPPTQFGAVCVMPQAVGSHGVGYFSGTTRPSTHERFSTLGGFSGSLSSAPQSAQGDGLCSVRRGAPLLASPLPLGTRGAFGVGSREESGHDRCEPVRLGGAPGGSLCQGCVEQRALGDTHKLSGTPRGLSGPEALPAFSVRPSCPSENRQHHDCGIYKPPGGAALHAVTHTGTQTDPMVQQASPLNQSHPRPGCSESGGGSVVQRDTPVRGLETASSSGGTDLDPVRHSRSGSFCLQGECSVSSVLLPARPRRSTRRGRAGARLATGSALRFSPSGPDTIHLAEGTNPAPHSHSGGPILASHALGGGHFPAPGGPTLETAASQGPGVPSGRLDLPPSSRTAGPVGLAPEGCGLVSAELPQAVIRTIQNARAPSTRSLYDCKWRVFEAWCQGREVSPFQCPVNVILSFLQDLLDGKKAFSTIKVYLAAISARHLGFGKKLAGQHPLVCSFMKGARRLLPVSRPLVPSWDLSLVLSALSGPPFEPMDGLDLKILSLKVVLLLALVSAKRVSDLQALSVHPSCAQFAPGDMKVSLKPNPAFVPKVVGSFSPIILTAFYPPPFSSPEEERWHKLCPIRALKEYVNRTENLRRGDQLFVSWGGPRKGKPVTKQRLSHWIAEAISMAYSCQGIQAPVGLRAHSTRGLSASWALFRGLSIQEICAAASWASPLAFARFYKLDVSVPAMTHTILSVGSLAGQDVPL
nr:uncharacterized protein LOC129162961 [Nothobranchius furzeri]